MSQSNGEKARAAINKRRRTAQREKDRARRAELARQASGSGQAEKTAETSRE